MNYEFPIIEHIDDVLHIAKKHDEIVVAERDGYTIFDYAVAFPDTFPPIDFSKSNEEIYHDMVMREFRGLTFCNKTGLVLRRPYHKFHNYGEREETMHINPHNDHIILDKLDGSMIAPFISNDKVYWGTRLASIDFHNAVDEWVSHQNHIDYIKFVEKAQSSGLTPIFEWVGPRNRIVVGYDNTDLILTGMRTNYDGKYIPYNTIRLLASLYYIPVVNSLVYDGGVDSLMEITSKLTSEEGYVIRFNDGHMVKMKSDWYIHLHKVKSHFTLEKDVVRIILENNIDDMISVLDQKDQDKINAYSNALHGAIRMLRQRVLDVLDDVNKRSYTKKDFALCYHSTSSMIRSLVFKQMDTPDLGALELDIIRIILGHTSSGPKWTEFKKKNKIELEW